ncbi:MAG: hypothetical protein QOJ64_565 [Acidobacteriota bacterium]|jgi:hypothetical protein|nr:hypothetical protein [Acidobacteriota bacterium]
MDVEHSVRSDASAVKLLAVSFCFPPLAYPRSIQVARLLKHLRSKTVLVCADEKGARQDHTIDASAEEHLMACLRLPFSADGSRSPLGKVLSRLDAPLWNKAPDQYTSWKPSVLRAVDSFAQDEAYTPNMLVTFGHPMSDHLIGLELQRRYLIPWVAHFSDPWVDNSYNRYDSVTRRLNAYLEKKVITSADRVIFTSQETSDLVLSKYPEEFRKKAKVIPHSFDESLYPRGPETREPELTVRYIGEFYGKRTPKPLIETLRAILASAPQLLTGVRFELIGPVNPTIVAESGLESLPEGLVVIKPAVNYRDSLQLAASADGLLLVDAPAKKSVFLASKLIDYVGAAKPILGITPPGSAAALIGELGGWIADPTDPEEMRRELTNFLRYLSANKEKRYEVWGDPSVRKRYEAPVVAACFENMFEELVSNAIHETAKPES